MRILLAAASTALIAGCGEYPHDIEGTTERLEAGAPLRVGVVAGTPDSPEAQAALSNLAARFDVPVERSVAPASLLLDRLDKREIDLMVGQFARRTPLAKEASFSRRIGAAEPEDGRQLAIRFARKHGENRWIMLTDREAGR